jgi:alkylation response protein AidB-like acyl-CoA dehydrogenase
MRYGTQAQRDFFLPKILTGEHIWAQGYSEPNSGSDLVSLSTKAVLEDGRWIINGQKIWTTLANDASWIYLLVRTDKLAKKQEGISFLLVPMDSPGITVRPIITMGMTDEFCQVFFDNVSVPQDAIVGELNKGWSITKALLGFERIFLGAPAQSSYALSRLEALARDLEVWSDHDFRQMFTKLAMDLEDHRSLYETYVEKLRQGETIGPDVSMLKVNQTELYKRITQAAADLAGPYTGYLTAPAADGSVKPAPIWMASLQTTIYGGSSEVQRGIIAKQVLGLSS